jgi:hypothetical protein
MVVVVESAGGLPGKAENGGISGNSGVGDCSKVWVPGDRGDKWSLWSMNSVVIADWRLLPGNGADIEALLRERLRL